MNDKVKAWAVGVRRALAWFAAEPARRSIDADANRLWDRILAAYDRSFPRLEETKKSGYDYQGMLIYLGQITDRLPI